MDDIGLTHVASLRQNKLEADLLISTQLGVTAVLKLATSPRLGPHFLLVSSCCCSPLEEERWGESTFWYCHTCNFDSTYGVNVNQIAELDDPEDFSTVEAWFEAQGAVLTSALYAQRLLDFGRDALARYSAAEEELNFFTPDEIAEKIAVQLGSVRDRPAPYVHLQ